MPVSPHLELLEISESQAAKATAANTAVQAIEKALADMRDQDTSAAVSAGHNITLPYASGDLGDKSALRFIVLRLLAGAAASFNVIHPTKKHLFVVVNNTSQTATIKCSGQPGVAVGAGNTSLIYCTGTDCISIPLVAAGGGLLAQTRELNFSYYGSPPSSVEMGKVVSANPITFPANFVGSRGFVETNPAAAYDIDVQDDGVSIGTISISTAGAFSFATAGGTDKVVAAGSVITLVSDSVPDASLTEIFVALTGTL
jgi:hypothetical protein